MTYKTKDRIYNAAELGIALGFMGSIAGLMTLGARLLATGKVGLEEIIGTFLCYSVAHGSYLLRQKIAASHQKKMIRVPAYKLSMDRRYH